MSRTSKKATDDEYKKAASELAEIDQLTLAGVLTSELLPERSYLHWGVIKPNELPEWLGSNYEEYGEVRWYRV